MPGRRKLFLPNSLLFVTFRTEEGLPFVPTDFINEILWSSLAKAQALYPVEVCAFNYELNHAHMLLRVTNPEHIHNFVGYVKQESAHALNRLLGRRRKTVWAEDYDSPTVLDENKALEMFEYLILNPVKDNLTDSMDDYPGVSSWKLMKHGRNKRRCRAIARNKIPKLKNPERPWNEEQEVSEFLKENNRKILTFELSPFSWKQCFADTRDLTDAEVRKLIFDRIEERAQQYLADKREKRLPKPRPERLKFQSILRNYVPQTFGKRMICLSSVREMRKRFINFYRGLCEHASDVLALWRKGCWHVPFPTGLFPPSLPRRANICPASLWAH
jgi:REP element-mobilizing transposase RayT